MHLRLSSSVTVRSSLFLLGVGLAACSDSKSSGPAAGGDAGSSVASAGSNGSGATGGASSGNGGSTSTGGSGDTSGGGEAGAAAGVPIDNGTGGSSGGTGVSVTPDPTKDCGAADAAQVPDLKFTEVAEGLTRPVYMTQPPGETERLFVVEKIGRVRILRGNDVADDAFLDVSANVTERYEELGLLGLAFHPKYADNGRFYVYYSTLEGNTVFNRLVEYTVSSSSADQADPSTARILFEVQKPEDNHNGGNLQFGPDGYLYIGTGDGGGGGDQHGATGNAQNLGSLLGKMLRIDVDGTGAGPNGAYGIPAGNMTGDGIQSEIWSYGLRNPWRYSFDPCTGEMYIGDVGQDDIEEVDVEPAQTGGRNYGWRLMEADSCFNPGNGCDASTQNLVLPVASYTHAVGRSITGGYVYRGSEIPGLRGTYLYADYETQIVFALRMQNGQIAEDQNDITDNINADGEVKGIGSFAQDNAGNLYAIEFGGSGDANAQAGRIFRVDPR
jgi:glucose/arabinose dehydrogenase